MAYVEDMIEQIKNLQQQNEVRSQETQALRTELKQEEANRVKDFQTIGQEVNNITANYQAEIAKLNPRQRRERLQARQVVRRKR